jgi:hypothetical protein
MGIARPRFELGSKAPKASMLGHYIQREPVHSTGLPGSFYSRAVTLIMLLVSLNISHDGFYRVFHFLQNERCVLSMTGRFARIFESLCDKFYQISRI